ncbi:MAG TPA: glycosyltransferase [Chloroflexota bacterium]|nr:glycosyltransferase [Chloroflexota bacterium]
MADVSLAIATVDRPAALGRCLDGVLSADVLPAEIIVIDQSDGDATRAAVATRQRTDVDLRYVRAEQRSASAARNTGIRAASSPLFAVTDDDCVPDDDWIATLARTLAAPDGPEAVTGRVLALGPSTPGTFAVSLRQSTVRADFKGRAKPWLVGTGGNFAARREWLQRVAGYDERLGPGSPGKAAEDMDLIYRLLRAGARIRYEPDAVIYHERKSLADRRASRRTYGYGMGAFFALALRSGDVGMVAPLTSWLLGQSLTLGRALAARRAEDARHPALSIRGLAAGMAYGWVAHDQPRAGRTFA